MTPRTCAAVAFAALALALPATAAAAGRVVIAPVQVEFHKDWLAEMNSRGRSRVGAQDAQRIADDMATTLRDALAGALQGRGFDIVGAAVPGAIVVSARVLDLWVNAPTNHSPGMETTYVRDAGHATLTLEGRDPATGKLHVESTSRETAGFGRGFTPANDVTNRFWFDSMFRRWADERARELNSATR